MGHHALGPAQTQGRQTVTDDEKRIITEFVARVAKGDAASAAPSPWNPAAAAAREPIDAEADKLITDLHAQYPTARYRLAQLAFFQEHAMAEAQNRIRQLEWELENKAQPASGGMLGGLFGGGNRRPATPPPAPVHAPGFQPGMFQQRPGFLGTAATMAVGVIGGVLIGNAIAGMLGMGGTAEAATPAADAMATPTASAYEDTGIDSAVFDEEEF
jgi:hypothetical protein